MMSRKKILLLVVLVLSLSMLNQVYSYISAEVNNTAALGISKSENSLIALPENLLMSVKKTFQDEPALDGSISQTLSGVEIVEHNLEITNNMGNLVNINIVCDNEAISFEDLTISSGMTIKAISHVAQDIEDGIYNLTIHAYWDGGSAEIKTKINVKVYVTVNAIQ